jgi:putative cardiolipin synthase
MAGMDRRSPGHGWLLVFARRWLAVALAVLAAGCAALPSLEGREESFALTDTQETRLGRSVAALTAEHPGKTGIHPLALATDAFAARALLAEAAQRSIDAQYYIWHGDQTGLLLFDTLASAARRGVRVRILLDDQNTRGLDETIAALGTIPNVEVRLYNPFAQRGARFTEYLGDFDRVNHRMHNKAFIADSQAAIVGGRNIGNEYFGAGTQVPFRDLDVLAIGSAVREIYAQFDLYWNSASAYPSTRIVAKPAPDAAARLEERFAAARADPESRLYLDAVRGAPLVQELLEHRLALEWADARLVRDDPAKTLDKKVREDTLLLSEFMATVAPARASFDIISPYFVPGEKGTAALEKLAQSGVHIRVLTNSLAGTDVAVVHSGYAKRRCQLARAGVRLYELKPALEDGRAREKSKSSGGSGSSAARLHAKTFAMDGERVFVGSFNFDPRSALLNTEMGLVIESRELARRLSATFDDYIPANSYEVRARTDGDACVEWIERTAAGEVRHETEPGAGWGRRAWLGFLMLLPLDWML